jgi:hypothetical protein
MAEKPTTNEDLTNIPVPKSLLKTPSDFSRNQLLVFVAIFAVIGGYLLFRSFAASNVIATLEAEQMSLPTGSSIVNDPVASGGQAVKMTAIGSLKGTINLPSQANSISLVARATSCPGGWPYGTLMLDSGQLFSQRIKSTNWTTYSATTDALAGSHSLTFIYSWQGQKCTPTLYLDSITVYGPNSQPIPAPTVSLGASPSTVVAGQASTLTWNSTNATTCNASGAWSGSKPTSGSASTGALNQTSTYTLTCIGPGGSGSSSTTVTVNPAGGTGTTRDVYPGQSVVAAINLSSGGDTIRLHAGNYPQLTLSRSFATPLNIVGENGVIIAGVVLPNVSGYNFDHITSTVPDDRNCCDASAFYVNGHTGNITLQNSTLHGGFVTLKFYSGSDNESDWAYNVNIHDNDISGTGGDLIHVDCLKDSVIEHNFIHDPGQYFAASDEHHDGIQDQASDNLKIIRNSFKADGVTPQQSQGTGQAILLQTEPDASVNRWDTNTLVANNLIYNWNFGLSVQILQGNRNTQFVNNTVYAGWGTSLTISSGQMASSNLQIWNNILDDTYLNDSGSEVGFYDTNWFRVQARSGMSGTHAYSGDPQFADTTNFALRAGSPAKSLGLTRAGTPSVDIDNAGRPNPPELGARL